MENEELVLEEKKDSIKVVELFKKFLNYFNKENLKKFVSSKYFLYLLSFVASFLILMVCSGNSFLYPFNTWVDINMYMTVGDGMLEGMVMYKDIFDHKGPIVYFVFAFFNLFEHPYVVCYILESICMGLFIIITFHIVKKWIENDYLALSASIIVAYVTSSCAFFGLGGGAVEEFLLPVFAYFILLLLDIFEGKEVTKKQAIIIGILVAIVFWVKFNLIIMLGLVLLVWFVFSLVKKNFKQMFSLIAFMAIGFFAVTILIIIYFLVNGAFKDLWEVYFYNNLFLYKETEILERNMSFVIANYKIFIFMIIGLIPMVLKYKLKALIYMAISIICFIVLFSRKCYEYYFLQMMVYFIFGVVAVFELFKPNLRRLNTVVVFVTIIATFTLSFKFSNYVGKLHKDVETYTSYKIAQEIKNSSVENPTMFIYKIRDIGFYSNAGIAPTEKYFGLVNFDEEALPEMWQSFKDAISNKRNDFVVTSPSIYKKEKDFLEEYYDIYKEYSDYILLIKA